MISPAGAPAKVELAEGAVEEVFWRGQAGSILFCTSVLHYTIL